jgi:UDP-glucuronate 4-epimerase
LEACRAAGICHIVFASSSSVYGNNPKVPFSEADPVDHPISPYASTKKAGELTCHVYSHLFGMRIACLRFFTVYGPRQRPDLAIHKFVRLIHAGEPIPFFGDGETRRDYTYVDDTIDGVVRALDWVFRGPGGPRYDVFNLGESKTVSLRQMVEAIERVTGLKANLRRLPPQPGDVNVTFADGTKSSRELGYRPSTDFEAGLRRFVEWYREDSGSRQ